MCVRVYMSHRETEEVNIHDSRSRRSCTIVQYGRALVLSSRHTYVRMVDNYLHVLLHTRRIPCRSQPHYVCVYKTYIYIYIYICAYVYVYVCVRIYQAGGPSRSHRWMFFLNKNKNVCSGPTRCMHTVTTFVTHAPPSHLACMVGHPNICSKRLLSRSAWCNVFDESLPALLLRSLIPMADLQLMMLWTVMGWAAQLVMTMWGKLGGHDASSGGEGGWPSGQD